MKTYNIKLSLIVFSAIVVYDAVSCQFRHWLMSGWPATPLMVINSPGIPLFRYFADFVRAGYLSDGCLAIGCVLFSAAIWSVICGFVFRRKYAEP